MSPAATTTTHNDDEMDQQQQLEAQHGKYRWTEYRDVSTAARVIEHAPQCSAGKLHFFHLRHDIRVGADLIPRAAETPPC